MILDVLKGFVVLFLIFVPMERVFTLRPQKVLRHEWGTDVLYYFIGFFIGRASSVGCIAIAGLLLAGHSVSTDFQQWVAAQPIALQFVAAILIGDFGYYMAHRLMHTVPWLWKFHSIHHSIEEMDWLAAVRVHPVEQVFTKVLQIVPLYWLGFSVQTFAAYTLFSAAIAFYIHSNTRPTARLLRWVVATPEFHHWHHANEPGVRNKNFAVQTPLMDLLFGTLYLPNGKRPRKLGNPYALPSGYFQQFVYPFKKVVSRSKGIRTTVPKEEVEKALGDFQKIVTRSKREEFMAQTQSKPKKESKFSHKRPLLILLGLIVLAGAGTFGIAKANNMSVASQLYVLVAGFNTPMVTTTDLQQQKVKPIVMIDVRTADEYKDDHIGKSLLVPVETIENGEGVQKIQEIAKTYSQTNRTQPTLVLYCAAGPRSIKAYHLLKEKGITANVTVLSGGIRGWRASVTPPEDANVLSPIAALPTSAQAKPLK
jgi:sterol desaturase/sphingolipid hydroxylase (fatty acid hydroxylase superfamily)/rhodanese-related sulfurtransferase